MSRTITILLLFFAAASFAGAGVAYAIGRARELAEGEADKGMRLVAALLAGFGATCAYIATGISGALAIGSIASWSSYILTAQRIGVFRIEQWRPIHDSIAERRRIA